MQSSFLPQTKLNPDQQRVNFTLFDNPVMDVLLSPEAEAICSKMFLIYARLKRADWKLWERAGVLYLTGEGTQTAWQRLCALAGVASATLAKSVKWMAKQGIIGYFAGKNGVGIRIYFNVALKSIRQREKNLRLVPTSSKEAHTSANEAPSCDSEAVTKNIQNSDLDAPREIAAPSAESDEPAAPTTPALRLVAPPVRPDGSDAARNAHSDALRVEVGALRRSFEALKNQLPSRDWMEKALIPKAARVAVAEIYRAENRGAKKGNAYVGAAPPAELPELPAQPLQHSEFWQEKLALIAPQVSGPNLETWFLPLDVRQANDDVAVIAAPDGVFRDWLETNYADVLNAAGLVKREWVTQK